MLITSELEFIFSATYHQWLEDHTEQEQGRLLCDCCGFPSTDGCLYHVPGGDDGREELLVCHPCFLRVYGAWGGSKSWEDTQRVLM